MYVIWGVLPHYKVIVLGAVLYLLLCSILSSKMPFFKRLRKLFRKKRDSSNHHRSVEKALKSLLKLEQDLLSEQQDLALALNQSVRAAETGRFSRRDRIENIERTIKNVRLQRIALEQFSTIAEKEVKCNIDDHDKIWEPMRKSATLESFQNKHVEEELEKILADQKIAIGK